MRTRIFVLLVSLATLVLSPSMVSGDHLSAESTSSSPMFNPLTYVETRFDLGLNGAFSVAVSPDGSHVYVVSDQDNAIATFGRNGATGMLAFVDKVQLNGGLYMNAPKSVSVSPDGKHVYVASVGDNAVTVFGRSPSTGVLSYVERIQDGGSVDGLDWPSDVTVSPDGDHVYVAAGIDDSVAIFSRSVITGGLTYEGVIKDGGSVDGLDGANSVVVSPGGDHVYVASSNDDAVVIFSRDGSTGALTYEGMVQDGAGADGLNGAGSVVISSDGGHVYAAGMFDNAVAIFSRNGSTGALTYEGLVQDDVNGVAGMFYPVSVAISADGSHVYVASLEGAIAIFGRNPSTGALAYQGVVEDDENGVDGLDDVVAVTVSPDGKHVYAAGNADDAVIAFARDGITGALTFLGMWQSLVGLNGPVGAAVSPDGNHVYVTGNEGDAVVAIERNRATGALTYVETKRDGDPPGVDGLDGARAVAMDPAGANVYVAGFSDDAVAVFSRSVPSGHLTYLEMAQDQVDGVDGLDGAQALTVSPDGKHVYVAGYNDDAVAIFSRSVITGGLSYEGVIKDGVGADGLDGAYAVAVSPDGNHVYVAGITDDAVAIFDRNETTGLLTYHGVVKDTDTLVNGLDGANSLAFSPDGEYLYVASRNEDAVSVLQRNPSTGDLYEIEVQRDGVAGVDGLDGARAVAVSPDGSQVYVASQVANTLVVFARHEEGELYYVGMHQNNVSGVQGLDTAGGVAVSPDSAHVYVMGYGDDAVALFAKWRVYLPLVLR